VAQNISYRTVKVDGVSIFYREVLMWVSNHMRLCHLCATTRGTALMCGIIK
jgi:hypothetical protein